MTTVNNRLGRNVRRLRNAHGWTQDELAERVGNTARNYIASLETGRIVDPGVHKVHRLAVVLGVSMESLLDAPEAVTFTLTAGQEEIERRFPASKQPFESLSADEYDVAYGDLGLPRLEIYPAAQRALAYAARADTMPSEWERFSFYATGALAMAARARN